MSTIVLSRLMRLFSLYLSSPIEKNASYPIHSEGKRHRSRRGTQAPRDSHRASSVGQAEWYQCKPSFRLLLFLVFLHHLTSNSHGWLALMNRRKPKWGLGDTSYYVSRSVERIPRTNVKWTTSTSVNTTMRRRCLISLLMHGPRIATALRRTLRT